eukprot:1575264-Rhodomonas_salina.1
MAERERQRETETEAETEAETETASDRDRERERDRDRDERRETRERDKHTKKEADDATQRQTSGVVRLVPLKVLHSRRQLAQDERLQLLQQHPAAHAHAPAS